jgi:hypothetical protein
MDNQLEFDSHYAILECSFILDDPRLDALTPTQRWLYVVLWCRAVQLKQETIPYHGLANANASIARLSRIDARSVASAVSKLQQLCLINVTKMGDITVCGVRAKHPKLKWKTTKRRTKKGKITPIYNTDTNTDTKKEDISSESNNSDQSSANKDLQEKIKKVYDFYIEQSDRNPNLYKLTKLRKQKIIARLKDGFTVKQLSFAIQAVLNNPFNMGENKEGKKYIDLVNHIFKSHEKTEQRINEYHERFGE